MVGQKWDTEISLLYEMWFDELSYFSEAFVTLWFVQ